MYFALGRVALWVTSGEPAYALNLASAVTAAAAAGVFALVAAELAGSAIAGAGAGLLFGVSYTFWSQAIIAEVYALHALFVGLTMLLLLRWQRRPTLARLAGFFFVYAIGFGNHLSMILLAPAYAIFLLHAAPGGWRSLVTAPVVLTAVACAVIGALQYTAMLRGLWLGPHPPHGMVDALRMFWFDVTKSDWRDTTVLAVPQSMIADRAAMYWFDVRQQFGVAGPVLAALGMVHLAIVNRSRALLLFLLFAVNAAFAYSYNVGDSHVFYLPSHAMLAMLAACGIALAGRFVPRMAPLLAAGLVLYAAARAYIDKPALDRSRDLRPAQMLAALTDGIAEPHQLLLVDVSWQVLNGLAYFAKVVRPDVLYAWAPDVLLYVPALHRDNAAIDRRLVATLRAADAVQRSYGPWFTITPTTAPPPALSEFARTIPAGTRYALCLLKPTRDFSVDRIDAANAIRTLTGGGTISMPDGEYTAVVGVAGKPPVLLLGSNRPFARQVVVGGVETTIRMDSWLAADTIRRMGFGHVVAGRQPTLTVERGISVATFGDDGVAIQTRYFANYFAAQPVYLIDSAQPFR